MTPLRVIKHENVWADAGFHREGYMQGRRGQLLPYHDLATRLLAACLADTDQFRIDGKTRLSVSGGRLHLYRASHSVLVRRNTGRHLQAAIRRLNYLRKNNTNVKQTASTRTR
jgi:hypothetical protein